MAVNPLTDSPDHLCDDDDEGLKIKKEIVEEEEKKIGGKRKHHTSVMKDKTNKTSQTNSSNNKNNKKLSPSKSKKHGTSRSAGKGKCVSCQLENTPSNGICGPGQVKSPAMIQAKHVRSSLGTELPSFSKLLVRSHVDSNSMSIPASFCRSHLPINDSVVVLVDESEEQFEVKYFPKWTGLSGGWRKFSLQHKLSEGDVLVFQLVAPSKFKVYIIRANGSSEIDGAPSLVDLDAHAEHNEPDENLGSDNNEDTHTTALKMKKMKSVKSFSQTAIQKKNKKALPESEIDHEVRAEFSEYSNSSKPTNPCKGLETLEDFNIMLNELCMEYSELHENMRKKYYELCCSKNVILHDGLPPSFNSKLVAGIIGETVNIADAIKACNFATSKDELEQWEKSLKSFELLGMDVGFLLDRVSQLLRLASESNGAPFEDEIKNLEVKRVELKEAYEKIGGDIKKLKSKAERQHLKFRELVNAPW
ncbi:hypothetical protein LguiA_017549 [Lonicera macranthoides]